MRVPNTKPQKRNVTACLFITIAMNTTVLP